MTTAEQEASEQEVVIAALGGEITYHVIRDGTDTVHTLPGGHDRIRIALDFALADFAGWYDGRYDEILWVRRAHPHPEQEPGHAIRINVGRDLDAEKAWNDVD